MRHRIIRRHATSSYRLITGRGIIALLLISLLLVINVPPVVAASIMKSVITRARSDFYSWLGSLAPQEKRGVRAKRPETMTEKQGRVSSLRVNPGGQVVLKSREPMLFAAIPADNEGNAIHGLRATWTSSDQQVVFVSKDGQAMAGKPGHAVLTASAGNMTATVNITVVPNANREQFGKKKQNSMRNPSKSGALNLKETKAGRNKLTSSKRRSTKRSESSLRFRHHEMIAASMVPTPIRPPEEDPLPDSETGSLYDVSNATGSPPGKRKLGAGSPAAATEGTETNGNQNFTFALPVIDLAGRGLNVAFSLIYNSQAWNKSTDPFDSSVWMTYDVDSGWPCPGFRLGLGQIEDQGSFGFTFTDSTGTRHALVNTGGNNYATVDGTFIQYTGGSSSGTLIYPDGMRVIYGAAGGGLRSYPTKVTDRNGNYVLINYVNGVGPRISSIQDTLERYINFYYAANGELIAITAPGLTGQADRQMMRFYYTDVTLGSSLFDGSINVSGPTSVRVLQYVYLPVSSDITNGDTGYKFDYSPYGMIRQITQSRGMTVDSTSTSSQGSVSAEGTMAALTTYSYPTSGQSLTDVPKYSTRTDDWAGRTTGGSAPFYQFDNSSGTGEKISTITAPDGTITEVHSIDDPEAWNHGLVKESIIKFGSTIFSTTVIDWEQTPNGGPPRVASMRVTNDGSPRLTKATVYSYTSFNNVSSVSEREFTSDGSISSTELRRTETSYVDSSNYINRRLLRLPSSVKVFPGGSNTPASRVDYAYDDYGTSHGDLTPRNDIIMHDPAFDPFQPTVETNCRWECWDWDFHHCLDWQWVCDLFNPYDPSTDYRGNVTSVTSFSDAANGTGAITHSSTYDIAGNTMTTQVDCCQLKSFTYSGAGTNGAHDYASVISVVSGNPSGTHLTTAVNYDYNTGLPSDTTDENGQITTMFYNAASLRVDHVEYPGGGAMYLNYADNLAADGAGFNHYSIETQTRLDNNGTGGAARYQINRAFMDGRGAVARTMIYQGATDGWATHDVQYDSMGRAFRSSNPYFAADYSSTPASASSMFWTTSHFDHLGRVYQLDMPRGDNDNSLLTSVTTTFDGIYTTVTDQANKSRRQKTDALDRVIRLDEPTPSGLGDKSSPNQPTHYHYDTLGNLVRINQDAQNRYFKYDSLSRLIRERQVEQIANSDYDLSDALTGNSSWTRKIVYNSNNLVTDSFDARGIHTQFAYDGLNRVTTVTYSDSTPTLHYFYDAQSLPEGAPGTSAPDSYSRGYSTGRLVAMTYGSGATGNYFGYDVAGRINMQFQLTGATPAKYKLTYDYNLAGLLTGEVYPSSRALTYAYDEAGRLASVSDGSTTFASGFQYAQNGAVKSETFGNGMVHAKDFNRRSQVKQITLKQNSSATTALQEYVYSYGAFNSETGAADTSKNNSQVASITGKIGGNTQWLQGFSYDELSRLSTVAEYQGANPSSPTYSQTYTYDVYGNRFQAANATLGLQAVSASEIATATNRFIDTGSTPTTYDLAGNITNDTKFRNLKYEYDANGRQITARLQDNSIVQTAVYDCAGQRVQTVSNNITRTTVYDIFGQSVADYLGSNGATLERENVYRADQLLATDDLLNAAAPTSMAATPSSSNVGLSWSTASGATNYRVERKAAGAAYGSIGTTSNTSLTDSNASPGNAYLYRVCAADSGGNCTSAYSNVALGAPLNFAVDPTITGYLEDPPNATIIKADHITQLRTAINAVRSLAGLPAATWTNNVTPGATIYADDVREMRTKLHDALLALDLQTSSYTDSTIISFAEDPANATTVRVAHIRELRQRSTSGAGNAGSGGTMAGLKYVLFDLQNSSRVLMNNNGASSAIVVRHDFLPFGEEIAGNLGLRSLGQGYNAIDTNRQKYAATERDNATGLDHTPWRKYENLAGRWTSPDPYGGSAKLGDPQTFNRYTYVQNDPVNLIDPSGLYEACVHKGMTNFLAKLAGYSDDVASKLGHYAGDGKGGADSFKYAATNPINFIKGIFGRGPSARIHFASEATLAKNIKRFGSDIAAGDYQRAGFTLHSIEDVHGAHQGYGLPFGHLKDGHKPDRIIGDAKFMRAANEVFQVLSGNPNAKLSSQQTNDLIDAIVAACGKNAKNLQITRPSPTGGGGGGGGESGGGGGGGYYCTPYYWVYFVSYDGGRTWELTDVSYAGCW
jgi:RHS repeat-associated protein